MERNIELAVSLIGFALLLIGVAWATRCRHVMQGDVISGQWVWRCKKCQRVDAP